MIINGMKYACERCIRGHRVTSCNHSDAPLTMIKPKGRPTTQCMHCRDARKSRLLHTKCLCGTFSGANPNGCLCHNGKDPCTCTKTQKRKSPAATSLAHASSNANSPTGSRNSAHYTKHRRASTASAGSVASLASASSVTSGSAAGYAPGSPFPSSASNSAPSSTSNRISETLSTGSPALSYRAGFLSSPTDSTPNTAIGTFGSSGAGGQPAGSLIWDVLDEPSPEISQPFNVFDRNSDFFRPLMPTTRDESPMVPLPENSFQSPAPAESFLANSNSNGPSPKDTITNNEGFDAFSNPFSPQYQDILIPDVASSNIQSITNTSSPNSSTPLSINSPVGVSAQFTPSPSNNGSIFSQFPDQPSPRGVPQQHTPVVNSRESPDGFSLENNSNPFHYQKPSQSQVSSSLYAAVPNGTSNLPPIAANSQYRGTGNNIGVEAGNTSNWPTVTSSGNPNNANGMNGFSISGPFYLVTGKQLQDGGVQVNDDSLVGMLHNMSEEQGMEGNSDVKLNSSIREVTTPASLTMQSPNEWKEYYKET